jgi:hypothetical protein
MCSTNGPETRTPNRFLLLCQVLELLFLKLQLVLVLRLVVLLILGR